MRPLCILDLYFVYPMSFISMGWLHLFLVALSNECVAAGLVVYVDSGM